ncbi:rhamnan synthesis F family protein [Lacibacter sp. H375]|uniref:rhamnan synthesis F family protein n=1 Tax=Lacibacter sp. H375 TaxID=3133424 RepID=UPI0030BE1F54
MIAVFLHIYYKESIAEIAPLLTPLKRKGVAFYINLTAPLSAADIGELELPNAVVKTSPNLGKDIGGKFLLLQQWLLLGAKEDYLIFLHDKKSPHSPLAHFWKSELFKIIDSTNIEIVLNHFLANSGTGIVCSKSFIRNEHISGNEFNTTNNLRLKTLISKYNLAVNDYSFVAGTMFWCRASSYRDFFIKHSPLSIRATLESGNVDDFQNGTETHSWERLLSWICTSNKKKIYGI